MDCEAAMSRLWDYLDHELSDDMIESVKRHLDACKSCHPHVEFAERFLEALKRCQGPEEMPVGVRERVLRSLAAAGLV